jgi:hypothetical protein
MKPIARYSLGIISAAVALFVASIFLRNEPTGKASWEYVLKACGVGDLQKTRPLYFGASNRNGVGSIWIFDETTGDTFPASQLRDLTTRDDVVFSNIELACSGDVRSGVVFNAGASSSPVIFPASVSVKEAINQAVDVRVSVDGIVQEDAFWDRFNQEFQKLDANHPIRQGVELNNRRVMARAWKVRGFKATLSFNQDSALSVKAQLDEAQSAGKADATLQVVDDRTLQISSVGDLYIAGVFRKLSPSGLSAATGGVVSDLVSTPENANVAPPE